MQVQKPRLGYKKTEIGEIPEEWEVVTLSELCSVRRPDQISSSLYIGLEHIGQGNNNLLSRGNVSDFTSNKHVFHKGDILYGKLRPLLNKVYLAKEDGFCSTDILPLQTKGRILGKILVWWMSGKRFVHFADSTSAGTKMPRTSWNDIKEYKIALPQLKEQEKIASILSNVDKLIQNTDQIIEQTERLKKGLMQKLLTKGIMHTKFKKTPIGEIPEEWEAMELGDLVSLEYGEGLVESKRKIGNYPVFGSNGIIGYHDEALVNGPGIIIGRKGSIGEIAWSDSDFWPIDTTYYVALKQKTASLRWLYYLLNSLQLKKLNAATGVPGLNRNEVYSIICPLPKLEEQQKILSIISSVENKTRKQQQYMSLIQKLKTGLMQRLLTGKIRVKV